MTFVKRSTALALLIAASLPALQGCFPVVATGVGAAAVATVDRRTYGTLVTDAEVERNAVDRIEHNYGKNTHVDVISYNRVVLLSGQAPSAEAKADIERLVSGVPNVRSVLNEIQVGPAGSFGDRSNDAYITSKVKARFVDAGKFYPNHVKVATEAATVFLMGIVTRKEADEAVEIARTTSGVRKVVRAFEYVGEEQAKQLDSRPPENPAPATNK